MNKIAVTYEDGNVFQHFGHTSVFKLYEVEHKEVHASQLVEVAGSGHGALAGFLKDQGVDTLICGGIGGGAQTALKEAGIMFYGGVTGGADEAVEALLKDNLTHNPDIKCNHHGEGHTCSGHDGEHHGGHHGEHHNCSSH